MGEDVAFTAVEDDGGVAAKNGEVQSWLHMKKQGGEGKGESVTSVKGKDAAVASGKEAA
jgi:hypothetical protein